MLIPEVILYNTVSNFLKMLTDDFSAAPAEMNSLLYQMFYNDDNNARIVHEDFDWYEQAKSLLLRKNDSVRKVEISIGYNLQKAASPTIHILLPTENKGRFDTIGLSESTPFVISGDSNNVIYINREMTHTSTYHLMITSDNVHEVLLIYYFLHNMFIVMHDHFGLSGFLNLSFSGQDIQVQQDLVPANIFHRNFAIQFDWSAKAQFKLNASVVSALKFSICNDIGEDNMEFEEQYNGG